MKKLNWIISILFVALSLVSCSDDDDADIVNADKIVGKWQFDQLFEDGIEIDLTECEKQSTWDFFQNGTFTERDFMDENSDCTALEPINGSWKYLGNSMYELGDVEISPGVTLDIDVKITFVNNKMTLEYSFTDENSDTHVLRAIYVKI